ncbi:hypothetical protein COT23_01170 [Candidatus Kaiserbacteria bacterium CG08_land_8_20_14_0_20_50_21]|uniref:Methyltransferase n=1 Tax=Candidatus Kaiserbacteria bacterium CG08_land_8_20_14_0_20_50_21 TaxID=1974604 RepID=A0A2H0YY99_9BACT|nr:MAG: hypothetical protein COT23_01170 [Candidatus Kaiserbacteria bacterium CG08_land_8_20_14_0_20_50_21]
MKTHFIMSGNAFQVLPKIKKEIDAVIVDPPYNTANKNTKKLNGRKDRSSDFGKWDYFKDDDFLVFTERWIKAIHPLLKESGNLVIFCKLEYISDIKRIYEKLGFKHHATIIWHKTNPAPQIRKNGFLSSSEAILWATKGFDNKKISYTFNFLSQKEMHNFIETPICMGRERTKHPTQKPKKVISHLIKIFTEEGDWILDCFAGSGTTAEAANELGRNTISIENDLYFYKILSDRMMKLENAKIMKVKNGGNIRI